MYQLSIALITLIVLKQTNSLSSSIQSKNFIELTNLNNNNGQKQTLPSSFIETWPTWVLEENGTLSRIPDEESNTGYVNPTSIDELWQPIDLKRPDMKLSLGLHVRSGELRHAMPAIDISYGDGLHRNRGLCSVPIAHSWVDFGSLALSDWKRLQLKISSKQLENQKWTQLSISKEGAISQAIERAMLFLSQTPPDDMAEGSHLINVVVDADVVGVPKTNHEMRVTLVEEEEEVIGSLQVVVSASMSGSESEYLPDVYKDLFFDEEFQNTRYIEMKQRKEERNQEL